MKTISLDIASLKMIKIKTVIYNETTGRQKTNLTLSSLVWWSKTQKKKKIFFVLLTINLNKFSLLVGHSY